MNQAITEVLRKYPRAVLALRAAYRDRRLGLMLGAGLTRAFDFSGRRPPAWGELVAGIEQDLGFDPTSDAYALLSLTQRVDILFRFFLKQREIDPTDRDQVLAATGEWRDQIRSRLYDGAPHAGELLRHHPYLGTLLELVLKSPLTVTYNFDSFLEECLATYPVSSGSPLSFERPYVTVTDVAVPQRRASAVIYHINGYLPRNPLETPSDDLVFSEGEFSDQLVMTMAGHYATIAHHLVNDVYLLIGLSLDDPNLRHLLRSRAVTSPGRVHFVVRFLNGPPRDWGDLSEAQRGIAEASLDLHNLYSLYLTAAEIGVLGRLISMNEHEFREQANNAGVTTKEIYYLSGIPGIGKTTVLRHMGGLYTLDEWMEEPHPLLLRPHSELDESERERLDKWIAGQFQTKNQVLAKLAEGIYVVERGPLDPLAFEERDRVSGKARWYAKELQEDLRPLQNGHLVLLHGNVKEVERRLASRQTRTQPADYLGVLQDQMIELYGRDAVGMSLWHSTGWSIEELVKRIASLVYATDFTPMDLKGRLAKLQTSA